MSSLAQKYKIPLIKQRADPFIWKHTDGYYYFTASVPEYDRIEIRRAASIEGLVTAEPVTVWKKHPHGEMSQLIWAPELHYIDGRWLVYFAAGHTMEVFDHRMYTLACDGVNPLECPFAELGRIDTGRDEFALDATTFMHNGQQYLIWAEHDKAIGGNTNLYISRMADPVTLETPPVMLTKPEYDWECVRFLVNEGPAVVSRGDRIFLSYSASGVGREYCIGLLWADKKSDLLDAGSWTKSKVPVFQTSDKNSLYGPGHNSFTIAGDGKTDLLVYHARPYEHIEGDPLFDPNRHTCVQPFEWDDNDMPVFGEPGG